MIQTNTDNLAYAINNLTAVLNADANKEIALIESIQGVITAIKNKADSKDHQLRLLKNMLEILTAKEEQPNNGACPQTPQYSQPPININQPQMPPVQNSYIPTQMPPQQNIPVQAPASPIPTAEATYSIDQLSVAAVTLMDSGQAQALKSLLAKYQVPAMTSLPKEHYASFAADLRALGVKI